MQLTWQVYCAYAAWAIQMKFNIGKNGSKCPKRLPCAQHSTAATHYSSSIPHFSPSKDLSANMTAWDLRRHERSRGSLKAPKEPEGAVVFVVWKPITNNQVVYSVIVCVSVWQTLYVSAMCAASAFGSRWSCDNWTTTFVQQTAAFNYKNRQGKCERKNKRTIWLRKESETAGTLNALWNWNELWETYVSKLSKLFISFKLIENLDANI